MREVAVLGIGLTPVDEHWEKSLQDLAGEAILGTLQDAGIDQVDGLYAGNMMLGLSNHQQHLGASLAEWAGLRFCESLRVEAACSSAAAAFRSALIAVASGELDRVIAVAVEKMTESPGNEITAELASASDAEWEADQGVSFVALNALIMRRYMYEYGWAKDDFAVFSINAHANGVHNPNARFRKAITLDTYRKAAMIADPINLMDASPMGDGAAAVLLVPYEDLDSYPVKPKIRIIGSGAATDTLSIHWREDPLTLKAAQISSKKAYDQAGITPQDVDLFELHDAFSIMAALSLEAAGFAEKGQALRLANDGEITPTGRIPIATRGGLKARGHPVGATGMYQIVEVVQQLRGEAGENQIRDARIGMTQNIGGSGSNIITHILRRD